MSQDTSSQSANIQLPKKSSECDCHFDCKSECDGSAHRGANAGARSQQAPEDVATLIRQLVAFMKSEDFDLLQSKVKSDIAAREIHQGLSPVIAALFARYLNATESKQQTTATATPYFGFIRWFLLTYAPPHIWNGFGEDLLWRCYALTELVEKIGLRMTCPRETQAWELMFEYFLNVLLENHEFDRVCGPLWTVKLDESSREDVKDRAQGFSNFTEANLSSLTILPRALSYKLRQALFTFHVGTIDDMEHPEDAQRRDGCMCK